MKVFIHTLIGSATGALWQTLHSIPEIDEVVHERKPYIMGENKLNFNSRLSNPLSFIQDRYAGAMKYSYFQPNKAMKKEYMVDICSYEQSFIMEQAKVFPNSKFIWWVRNGYNVARTNYSRSVNNIDVRDKWYDLFFNVPKDCKSDFSLYCWQWSIANTIIKSNITRLPNSRWLGPLKAEDEDSLTKLLNFININKEANLLTANKTAKHKMSKYPDWNQQYQDIADRYMLPMLKYLEYV